MKDLTYKNVIVFYTEDGGVWGNPAWIGDTMWGKVEIEQEPKEHGGGFFWWVEGGETARTDDIYYESAFDTLKGFYEYMMIGNIIL